VSCWLLYMCQVAAIYVSWWLLYMCQVAAIYVSNHILAKPDQFSV
jgi:hypothetical protein